MIQNATYPKTELTKPPKRFAQLLLIDASTNRILLGKHARGEFEGRYTGFIAPVEPKKTFYLPTWLEQKRSRTRISIHSRAICCVKTILRRGDDSSFTGGPKDRP